MSSVGSLATNSCLSCHNFCCDRNTTARLIKIEEKARSINSFTVQHKERYPRPHVIVVSIFMLPLARMATSSVEEEEEGNILGSPFPPPPSLLLTLVCSEVVSLEIFVNRSVQLTAPGP